MAQTRTVRVCVTMSKRRGFYFFVEEFYDI